MIFVFEKKQFIEKGFKENVNIQVKKGYIFNKHIYTYIYWQSSAPGTFSTLVTSVVLYETRVCMLYIYIYTYIIYIYNIYVIYIIYIYIYIYNTYI